jgi:hypothetical protein
MSTDIPIESKNLIAAAIDAAEDIRDVRPLAVVATITP